MAKQIANPWLRKQLMERGIQMIDLAVLIGLPPHGPSWISEYVNRIRSRPDVERRLCLYFGLDAPRLRRALWPAFSPAPRARARPLDARRFCVATLKQESK